MISIIRSTYLRFWRKGKQESSRYAIEIDIPDRTIHGDGDGI